MPNYTVKQGDHLSKIASKYGFANYRAIWDHPENAEFKKKRKKPNILYPGDQLFIPATEVKEIPVATEQRHRFQVKGSPLKLRLMLKDINFNPLAQTKCVFDVDGKKYQLISDSESLVEHAIPSGWNKATFSPKARTASAKGIIRGVVSSIRRCCSPRRSNRSTRSRDKKQKGMRRMR